jgi:hypothetical protein
MDVTPDDLFEDLDGAMQSLEAAFAANDPGVHAAILDVLQRVRPDQVADPSKLVRFLERFLLERPAAADDIPYCLEFWLNRSAAIPDLRPRLEALAVRQIYHASRGEWQSIAHVVGMASDDPDQGLQGEHDEGLRDMRERLLRTMLLSSREHLSGLPDVLTNDAAARSRWTIDVLLDAPDAAWKLMSAACSDPRAIATGSRLASRRR